MILQIETSLISSFKNMDPDFIHKWNLYRWTYFQLCVFVLAIYDYVTLNNENYLFKKKKNDYIYLWSGNKQEDNILRKTNRKYLRVFDYF